MGVSYIIKLDTLVEALTVAATKQAEFLHEQTGGAHTTHQRLASRTGDYI